MRGEPYHGLHRTQHTGLDADVLLRELRREMGLFCGGWLWPLICLFEDLICTVCECRMQDGV